MGKPSQSVRPTTTYSGVVGSVLSKFRGTAKLGQTEMAAKMGLTQSSYSRLERGSSQISLEHFARAAQVLGIPSSHLLYAVEQSIAELNDRGIDVIPSKKSSPIGLETVLIGGAALGALVAGVMTANGFQADQSKADDRPIFHAFDAKPIKK